MTGLLRHCARIRSKQLAHYHRRLPDLSAFQRRPLSVRLILWDIDHTLLELQRLHYDLYERALPAAFGRQTNQLPEMTGRTDRDSTTEFLQAHGIQLTEE